MLKDVFLSMALGNPRYTSYFYSPNPTSIDEIIAIQESGYSVMQRIGHMERTRTDIQFNVLSALILLDGKKENDRYFETPSEFFANREKIRELLKKERFDKISLSWTFNKMPYFVQVTFRQIDQDSVVSKRGEHQIAISSSYVSLLPCPIRRITFGAYDMMSNEVFKILQENSGVERFYPQPGSPNPLIKPSMG